MKPIRRQFIWGLALWGLTWGAMAQTLNEKLDRLAAHELAHGGPMQPLSNEALLERVGLVLAVCETPVSAPSGGYVQWYAARVQALRNDALPRLKTLGQGSQGLSMAAEARSLARRVAQMPEKLTVARVWSGGTGLAGSEALGSIHKPLVRGSNASAHIGRE